MLHPVKRQFLITSGILGGLLLLEAALVLSCILWPCNRVLPQLAGITAMWMLVASGVFLTRIYIHCIKPCCETEKTCRTLARGEFPPPLPPQAREYFPELSRSVNLLRDRLQYLERAIRDRQSQESKLLHDGLGATLQAKVYAQLLPRLYRPLALIGGYLELEKCGRKLTRQQLEAASGQFTYSVQLLHRIIAGMHAGEGDLHDEVFDLNLFLRSFDEACQAKLRRRQMSLSCSYGADLPATICGNTAWLDWQLHALLHILFLESESGRRLEMDIRGSGRSVTFTFTDPGNTTLAADYRQLDDDPEAAGEDIPLPLLELRLAANRASEHNAVLTVEAAGNGGCRLQLTLDHSWTVCPAGMSRSGLNRFAENHRHQTLPQLVPDGFTGTFPVIVRGPETVDILQAWHPGVDWQKVKLDQPLPEGPFQRILAIIPVESPARQLHKLEKELTRAAITGTVVTVIDPGMHSSFRQRLRQCGIRDIHDTRLVYREFGATEGDQE